MMYLVRNVFTAKPGKAKELAAKFKAAAPILRELGVRNPRVLTDASAGFWTVVTEGETESLDSYVEMARTVSQKDQLAEIMRGYMDLVEGGYREIFKIE